MFLRNILLLVTFFISAYVSARASICEDLFASGYVRARTVYGLPEIELYNKKVKSSIDNLEWTVTPIKNDGRVRKIELGLSKPFIIPKWQIESHGKTYVAYNIGFKHLEHEIVQNQKLLHEVLRRKDDPVITKLTVHPKLKKALEFLKTFRWEAHDQVLSSYTKEKSAYLSKDDIYFLYNHDKGFINSDVFVLLENTSKELSQMSVDEFRRSLRLTIQVSYKNGEVGRLAPLFGRERDESYLPFESRVHHYSFEYGNAERTSDALGGVSPDILRQMKFWEDLRTISGGSNFAELTRYHSLGQIPRSSVLWFLGLAVTEAENRGVNTFVASGDEKTTRLFSIFYGMKKFATPLVTNNKGIEETLSYLTTDSPEFKAVQQKFLNP